MNKTKISNFQLFALIACFTTGTTVIAVPAGVASIAGRDSWITALITPILGLAFICMYYYLGKLNPGKSLIDMINSVFGKWVGFIISLFFLIFICLLDAAQVSSYIGNFVQSEYMTETPIYALNLLIVACVVIGLLYGLEAIARSAEIFIFVVSALIFFTLFLDIPNIKIDNILPIFEKGITPTLKGSLLLSSYITWPIIVLMMIFPINTDLNKKTRNSLFLGYLWGGVICFLIITMAILVLGSTITARSEYPTYLMAKEVNIGIINRIEGIISFAWILTESIRILLYFYAGVAGVAQLFKLKDYKKLVLPMGLVILICSGIVYPNSIYQTNWDTFTWVPFIITFGVMMPLILLIVSIIKDLLKKKKENKAK